MLHRHFKTILNHLHNYGVTCLYNEVLSFWLNRVPWKQDTISSFFNTEISSRNIKSKTHCLATITTKTSNLKEYLPHTTFHRFEKEEMVIPINDTYATELSVYDDSKKWEKVNPEVNLLTDFSRMQKISSSRGRAFGYCFWR